MTSVAMASTTAATSTGIKLKILVDTKSQKVVFADAGKDFVDFLFHISYLPVGTVMKLLAEHDAMGGSLTNIYQAIESSSEAIMLPSRNKDDILKPKCVTFTASNLTKLPAIQTSTSSKFHVCTTGWCSGTTANGTLTTCSRCSTHYTNTRIIEEPSVRPSREEKGYVKSATYMVMDDLSVRAASGISGIDIVNGLDIKNVGFLEAREVQLGDDDALKLLKASILSKTVLTDVFLRGKNSKDSK